MTPNIVQTAMADIRPRESCRCTCRACFVRMKRCDTRIVRRRWISYCRGFGCSPSVPLSRLRLQHGGEETLLVRKQSNTHTVGNEQDATSHVLKPRQRPCFLLDGPVRATVQGAEAWRQTNQCRLQMRSAVDGPREQAAPLPPSQTAAALLLRAQLAFRSHGTLAQTKSALSTGLENKDKSHQNSTWPA